MFWSLRENLCGLNHIGRLSGRLLLRRSRFYYVERLKAKGYAVEPVLDDRDNSLNCRLCGFTNLRFALAPGFEMTTCSSLALSVILHQDKLKLWSQNLPRSSKEALAKIVIKRNPGAETIV